MEWIKPNYNIRTSSEVYEQEQKLNSLSLIGDNTSLYNMSLLNNVKQSDLYILTSNGKARSGCTIKCTKTKQKDKVNGGTIKIIPDETEGVFQFCAMFPDGTGFDARGEYARENLKIIQRRKNVR